VDSLQFNHRAWIVAILACGGLWASLTPPSYGQSDAGKPSFTESISSKFSQIGQSMAPAKPTVTNDDPTSLQSKGKPTVELYVAVARLYEEQQRFAEAENQYKRGLHESPKDLRVLLGYARLKDRTGKPEEAVKLYKQAIEANPKDPSAYNNLAVHYARRRMLREAISTMQRAAELRPTEPKYRNNLATLFVEIGRPDLAFVQLRAVNDDAVSHYNLGYLLNKKGQTQAAAREFAEALRYNPQLTSAKQWLDRLNATQAVAANRQPQIPPQPSRTVQNPMATTSRMQPPFVSYPRGSARPPVESNYSPPLMNAANPSAVQYGAASPAEREPRIAANPSRPYVYAGAAAPNAPEPAPTRNMMIPPGPDLGMPSQTPRMELPREEPRQPEVRVLPPPPTRYTLPNESAVPAMPTLVAPQPGPDAPTLRRLPPISSTNIIGPEPSERDFRR